MLEADDIFLCKDSVTSMKLILKIEIQKIKYLVGRHFLQPKIKKNEKKLLFFLRASSFSVTLNTHQQPVTFPIAEIFSAATHKQCYYIYPKNFGYDHHL